MNLIEVSVETDGEAAEAVSALFNQYGRGGAVTEEVWSESSHSPMVRVKAFLLPEQSCALPRLEEALWHLGQIYPIPSPSVRWLSEADWAEAWKSDYKVQRIGRRIVIKPSWQPYSAAPHEIVIELDPGLAFGTGLHPSTRLALQALEHHLKLGGCVLDVGTGSGILAIAAAKLGARQVVALDIDGLALEVARENIARNRVDNLVSLHRASLTPSATPGSIEEGVQVLDVRGVWYGAFDLVLMNILADVIIRSAEAIAAGLAVEGQFVVSGIIKPQEGPVRQAFAAAGLTVVERRSKKDWLALIGRHQDRRRYNS